MMTKVVVMIEEDVMEGVIDIDVLSIMVMMMMMMMMTTMKTNMVIDEGETERVVIEVRNEEKGVIMTRDIIEDMTTMTKDMKDMIDIMADMMMMMLMMRGSTGEMTVQQDAMIEVTMAPDAMAMMIDTMVDMIEEAEEVQNSHHHHREISGQS